MATTVTRSGKGSPLTHAEMDANFTNLNTDKLEVSVHNTLVSDLASTASGKGAALVGFLGFGSVISTVAALATSIGASLLGFIQAGVGAVARSIESKLRGDLDLEDFGPVDTTGVTEATAVFNLAATAAAAQGKLIRLPVGTVSLNPNTVNAFPAGFPGIVGRGMHKSNLVTVGVAFPNAPTLSGSGLTSLILEDFSLDVNNVTYADQRGIQLTSCSGVRIARVRFPRSGAVALRAVSCSDVEVRNVEVAAYTALGMHFVTSGNRIRVLDSKVTGTGTSHAVQIQGGGQHTVSKLYTEGAAQFGFSGFGCSGITVDDCIFVDGHIEGVNVQDCTFFTISNNKVYQSQTLGTDFGISAFGDPAVAGNCYYGKIVNNEVYTPYKSGIALAARVKHVLVSGNTIVSPNRANDVEGAGVILYGPECQGNTVINNHIVDEGGKVRWGVNEWNDGTGAPSDNVVGSNRVKGTTLGENNLLASSSRAIDLKFASFTPTISPAGGAITSYTVNSAKISRRGEEVEMTMDISITNAGTGTGALTILFGAGVPNAASNGGALHGKENGVSGKLCGGICNAGGVIVQHADASTVIATGARIVMSGIYRIA